MLKGLYEKQQGVNATKSFVGCLFATAIMAVVLALVMWLAGAPLRLFAG